MKKDFLNTLANENSYKAYIRIFQGIEDLESIRMKYLRFWILKQEQKPETLYRQ